MPGCGRTFRRHCEKFWEYIPVPSYVDEVHKVIYIDGIEVAGIRILIAVSDDHVLSWHLARSENTYDWSVLLKTIAPPEMVVCDGAGGIKKALEDIWPNTKVQRCLFHVLTLIVKKIGLRTRSVIERELLDLAKDLVKVKDKYTSELWLHRYFMWEESWSCDLKQKRIVGNKEEYVYKNARSVRRTIRGLIKSHQLFTYLTPSLNLGERIIRTNNRIEGGVNAPIKEMLRNHRGLSTTRRIKAACWWCYMHTECPLSISEILRLMPRDSDYEELRNELNLGGVKNIGPELWGTGVAWEDYHRKTPYPYSYE